jgi:DNA-binding Xre family transcriptional regulator
MRKPVSHAGCFLNVLQAQKSLSDHAMADLLHIDQRVLSRLKYEKGAGISEDTLRVMIEHVSEDPDEQARFLACYLRDRICGPDDVTSLIRITVEDSVVG